MSFPFDRRGRTGCSRSRGASTLAFIKPKYALIGLKSVVMISGWPTPYFAYLFTNGYKLEKRSDLPRAKCVSRVYDKEGRIKLSVSLAQPYLIPDCAMTTSESILKALSIFWKPSFRSAIKNEQK